MPKSSVASKMSRCRPAITVAALLVLGVAWMTPSSAHACQYVYEAVQPPLSWFLFVGWLFALPLAAAGLIIAAIGDRFSPLDVRSAHYVRIALGSLALSLTVSVAWWFTPPEQKAVSMECPRGSVQDVVEF